MPEIIISGSGAQFPLIVNNDGSIGKLLTKKMDNNSSGQPTYIGEATPGANIGSPIWRLRKLEYDDGEQMPPTGELWGSGNTNFDKVWEDRDDTDADYS